MSLKGKIRIGLASSMRKPENWSYAEDDRMEQIKILGGVHYQDNGIFHNNVKATAVFSQSELDKLKKHRTDREAVEVYNQQQNKLPGKYLVKINSCKLVPNFDYYEVDFELLYKEV